MNDFDWGNSQVSPTVSGRRMAIYIDKAFKNNKINEEQYERLFNKALICHQKMNMMYYGREKAEKVCVDFESVQNMDIPALFGEDKTMLLFYTENMILSARSALDVVAYPWLSDYLPNKLGVDMNQPPDQKEKPDCALIGQNSNIFNLMGIASQTLKKNGLREQAKEMQERITISFPIQDTACFFCALFAFPFEKTAGKEKSCIKSSLQSICIGITTVQKMLSSAKPLKEPLAFQARSCGILSMPCAVKGFP